MTILRRVVHLAVDQTGEAVVLAAKGDTLEDIGGSLAEVVDIIFLWAPNNGSECCSGVFKGRGDLLRC